jgi:hypothetical protein
MPPPLRPKLWFNSTMPREQTFGMPRQSVAPAHGEIIADWKAGLRMSSCCRKLLFNRCSHCFALPYSVEADLSSTLGLHALCSGRPLYWPTLFNDASMTGRFPRIIATDSLAYLSACLCAGRVHGWPAPARTAVRYSNAIGAAGSILGLARRMSVRFQCCWCKCDVTSISNQTRFRHSSKRREAKHFVADPSWSYQITPNSSARKA